MDTRRTFNKYKDCGYYSKISFELSSLYSYCYRVNSFVLLYKIYLRIFVRTHDNQPINNELTKNTSIKPKRNLC